MKSRPNLPPLDPNQRYTIDESADYLRVSRPTIYKKVANGQIRLIEDGRRRFVPGVDLIAQSRPAA